MMQRQDNSANCKNSDHRKCFFEKIFQILFVFETLHHPSCTICYTYASLESGDSLYFFCVITVEHLRPRCRAKKRSQYLNFCKLLAKPKYHKGFGFPPKIACRHLKTASIHKIYCICIFRCTALRNDHTYIFGRTGCQGYHESAHQTLP